MTAVTPPDGGRTPPFADRTQRLPVGATLDRGFGLLRRNLGAVLWPQVLLYAVALLLFVVVAGVGYLLLGDVQTHTEMVRESTFFGDSTLVTQEVPDFTDGQIALLVVFGTILLVGYFVVSVAASISVIRAAWRAAEDAPRLALGAAVREAVAEAPRLIGWGLVYLLGLLAILLALAVVVGVLFSLVGGLGVLAGLAAAGAMLYLVVRMSLWAVVLVVEDDGAASFRRAWRLTAGRFWPLLGLMLLVGLVVWISYMLLSLLLGGLVGGLGSINDAVGTVALLPYGILGVLLGLLATAGWITPMVVVYRWLAGHEPAAVRPPDAIATTDVGRGPALPGASPSAGPGAWDAAESGRWTDPDPRS